MKTFEKYSGLRVALHWLTVLLVVAVYATIDLSDFFPKGSSGRDGIKAWHYMLGLSVLVLVFIRLLARWAQPGPPELPAPDWQLWLAKAVQWALYILLIGLPLAGWLVLSTAGQPVPFFGFELPPLMAPDKILSKEIKDLHETVADIGYFVIGLHAAAALFHHYLLRDNTLRRMWR